MHYFISTALGDDDNPGTQEKPWKTLARANAHRYENGDILQLRCGEQFSGFLHFSPDNVSIQDNDTLVRVVSYGRMDNLLNTRGTISAAEVALLMKDYPRIEPGTGSGIVARNIPRLTIENLIVQGSGYDTNTGFGVQVTNDAPGGGRLPFVRLSCLAVSGFRWAGIYVGGVPNDLPGFDAPPDCRYGFDSVTITDCEAHGNMYYGIYVSGPLSPGMTDYANANVTIRGCKAFDNPGDKDYMRNHSGSGVLLDNCSGGLIENCEAYGNGGENGGLTGGPCGIWAHCGDRITIRHCKAYSNRTAGTHDGGGFDLDGGVTNSVIENCESWDNDGAGYLMWNYENAPFTLSGNIVRNCTSRSDGRKHGYGGVHIGTSGKPVRDVWVRDCRIEQSTAPDGNTPPCVWLGANVENAVLRGNDLQTVGEAAQIVQEAGAENITVE